MKITIEKIPFVCTFCGTQLPSLIVMQVKWKLNCRGRLEPYTTNAKDTIRIKEWEHKNILEHNCSVQVPGKVKELYGFLTY